MHTYTAFQTNTAPLEPHNLNEIKYFVPVCIHTSVHDCTELHWSPHSVVTQLPPAVVPQSLAPQLLLLVCLNILSESIG